jgi:hypothetical protein
MAAKEPWVPTRLLDIGTSEDSPVRLLDRDETRLLSKQSYATLSHCWGSMNLIKTISSNLRSHQQEIPRGNLPLTFKPLSTLLMDRLTLHNPRFGGGLAA